MTFLSAPLTATPRGRRMMHMRPLPARSQTAHPPATGRRAPPGSGHDAGGHAPALPPAAPPPAPPRPGLPLRAWRAAGRILGRAGRSLAAAGRAGWTGARTAVVARVNAARGRASRPPAAAASARPPARARARAPSPRPRRC